jgi:iron complex outermembrane recepter protein
MSHTHSHTPVRFALAAASTLIACAGPSAVHAQDQSADAGNSGSADNLQQVVVTARKREESLLKVPVAVTAFSAEALSAMGAQDLEDISATTAGLNYATQGGQRPGRYEMAVRFRGMNTNQFVASQQLGTVLMDGVYMSSGVAGMDFSNIERVEVIKGPQSATFGRSTFGGVVNYVTRTPGFQYKGRVSADFSQYQGYDVSLSHEGPLIADKVSYLVSVRGYGTGGQYESAADGGALGVERTQSAFAVLYAEPTPNLKAKLRFYFAQDDDGPPASPFLGSDLTARGDPSYNAGMNCFNDRPEEHAAGAVANYYCGEIPKGDLSKIMRPNTGLTPFESEVFRAPTYTNMVTGEEGRKIAGVPVVDSLGLKRRQERWALSLDYDFAGTFLSGYTLSSLTGYNDMGVNWIRDYDLTHVHSRVNQDPQYHKDFSQEVRLTSPRDKRFRWSLGASYFDVDYVQHGNGGVGVSCADGGCGQIIRGVFVTGPIVSGVEGFPSESGTTAGVFGSLGFDITPSMTFDFEWRYQEDEIGQAFNNGTGLSFTDTFYSFLPRATLSYHLNDRNTLWGTYSVGNLPGFFNADIGNLDPSEIPLVEAAVGGDVSLFNEEETLKNYELGWRQQWFDGGLQFSLVAYHMDWTNLKTRQPVAIINNEGTEQILNLQFNGGDATLEGVEFESSFRFSPRLTGTAMLSYARGEYGNFQCAFSPFKRPVTPGDAFGPRDCSGNVPARYPDRSAALSLTWADTLGASEWSYFVRGDARYTGKSYTEEANFAWLGKFWLFNMRTGFEKNHLRVEGYVRNLFNDDHWLAGARWSDFSTASSTGFLTSQGIIVTPPEKRTIGVRVAFDF